MKVSLVSLTLFAAGPLLGQDPFSAGVAAFERRRWPEALEAFLKVLGGDASHARAHAYVSLISRAMEADRQEALRQERLEVLGQASRALDENRLDTTPILAAIHETSSAEERLQEEKWRALCEEARLERELGHLLAANDLVLQVLSENAAFGEAQRELSELQSRVRQAIDRGETSSIAERYALEGFYAYGQAEYAAAVTAWQKARLLVEQSQPTAEAANHLDAFRFTRYDRLAQARVEDDRRASELRAFFDRGMTLYQQGHCIGALDEFRKLAIREPNYPQLGYFLVQAEAGAAKERSIRLGEAKQRALERALKEGVAAMQNDAYPAAQQAFRKVLTLDPSHPEARSYLLMMDAEINRRQDPKTVQLHYEAGLIAYASGKLDEAFREWNLVLRMNPGHEKASHALAKVKKEMALYREAL